MIKKLPASAFLLLSGCAASAPHDQAVSRGSVNFVEPEKFTDSRRVELAPTSAGVLRELGKIFNRNRRTLPATDHETEHLGHRHRSRRRLRIISRAASGSSAHRQRPFPPRIVLEFELLDSGAKIIQKGKRHLTDLITNHAVFTREKTTCGMKKILRDWLRAELGVLSADKSK